MSDARKHPYETRLDTRYAALERVDVPAIVRELDSRPENRGGGFRGWFNQTLCKVNDSVVRLGVMTGEYHWHKHDDLDEFFFVLEGTFLIDLEDRTIELGPDQGFVVPRGIVHRTRAPQRCVILMVEGESIAPEGDD
jgi:mannose-6-phosphate isomerase-like protein (cupin superfamily)